MKDLQGEAYRAGYEAMRTGAVPEVILSKFNGAMRGLSANRRKREAEN
jgi:hypothetical protein